MARLIIVEDNIELAELMASAARSRGHDAHAVHSGALALSAIEASRYDGAIVDLLLPDIRGNKVLAALKHASVPAVAISGFYRGHPYSLQAVEELGAKQFFEKPFDLGALFEAVEKWCAPGSSTGAGLSADATPTGLESLDKVSEYSDLESSGMFSPSPLSREQWDPTYRPPGTSKGLKRLPPSWSLTGDLALIGLPRLLNAYYQARSDGTLVVRQGSKVKVITLVRGLPVHAASNLAQERFGALCVQRGLVSSEQLKPIREQARRESLRTGEELVRLGLINGDQRLAVLEDQIRTIIWSTIGWSAGDFSFTLNEDPPRPEQMALRLFPGRLILEGVFHTETLVTLREKVPAARRFVSAPEPFYPLEDLKLNPQQLQLYTQADGSKSVGDLVSIAELSEREALATLRGLELCGFLEERKEDQPTRRISFGL